MDRTIIIQKGQTLSEIAHQHHASVAELVRLNHLKNANHIIAGQQLVVPSAPAPAAPGTPAPHPKSTPRAVTPGLAVPSHSSPAEFSKDGRTYPNGNGYPVFAQGHNSATGEREPWADLPIGSSNVSRIGCAMTAVTMAVSGISGQLVTPGDMNTFMNKIGGFSSGGNIQAWSRMGELLKPQVKVTRRSGLNVQALDRELNAGRPVVVQVDYHKGHGKKSTKGYDGDGDHWILLTGRSADNRYLANDPAGGKLMTLHRTLDGRLESDSADNKYHTAYRTTGNGTTFDRGPAPHRVGAQKPAHGKSSTPVAAAPPPTPKKQAPPTVFIKDGRQFPSSNGYPVYAQGRNSDSGAREKWADLPIGPSNISSIGCAMTSVAMALSGLAHQTLTPDEMNRFMNKIGGFGSQGDIKAWQRMGELVQPSIQVKRHHGENFDARRIDQELEHGRPVVVQVDYHKGRGKAAKAGHDGVGDHWILITGRDGDSRYLANDPAGGKIITLHRTPDGKLEGDSDANPYKTKYLTTGQATTFQRPAQQSPAGGHTAPPKVATAPPKAPAPAPHKAPAPAAPSAKKPPAQPVAAKDNKSHVKCIQAPHAIETAISKASAKVGVDYGYMMAMAAQESAFDPTATAETSSATGLYQFLSQTWLGMVFLHGSECGLSNWSSRIKYSKTKKKYVVESDKADSDREKILALRLNPTTSALMGAYFAHDNQKYLKTKLGREVGPTELYMAHFLGPSDAAKFLEARDAGKGNQSAVEMFPGPAAANAYVFYSKPKQLQGPRTLNEVYKVLDAKIAPKAEAYTQARPPNPS